MHRVDKFEASWVRSRKLNEPPHGKLNWFLDVAWSAATRVNYSKLRRRSNDFAPRDDLDSHFRRRTTKQENHCATWSWRCKNARLWSRQRQVNVNFYSGFANHNPRSRQEKSNELSNRLTHDECVIYAASKHRKPRKLFLNLLRKIVRVSPLSAHRCQTAQITSCHPSQLLMCPWYLN